MIAMVPGSGRGDADWRRCLGANRGARGQARRHAGCHERARQEGHLAPPRHGRPRTRPPPSAWKRARSEEVCQKELVGRCAKAWPSASTVACATSIELNPEHRHSSEASLRQDHADRAASRQPAPQLAPPVEQPQLPPPAAGQHRARARAPGFHDPRSAFKPLEEKEGVIVSWKLLSSVQTQDVEKNRIAPSVLRRRSPRSNDKTVRVQGFMMPLEPGESAEALPALGRTHHLRLLRARRARRA